MKVVVQTDKPQTASQAANPAKDSTRMVSDLDSGADLAVEADRPIHAYVEDQWRAYVFFPISRMEATHWNARIAMHSGSTSNRAGMQAAFIAQSQR